MMLRIYKRPRLNIRDTSLLRDTRFSSIQYSETDDQIWRESIVVFQNCKSLLWHIPFTPWSWSRPHNLDTLLVCRFSKETWEILQYGSDTKWIAKKPKEILGIWSRWSHVYWCPSPKWLLWTVNLESKLQKREENFTKDYNKHKNCDLKYTINCDFSVTFW